MTKNTLNIGFCDNKTAKKACSMYHYTKKKPQEPSIKFSVFENNKFIGVVIFSRGSNNNLAKSFNLEQTEICELTRVALCSHKVEVSRILKICLIKIKKMFPSLKIVVSYADTNQNHKGGIYQAGNWLYIGKTAKDKKYIYKGKTYHSRSVSKSGILKMFGSYQRVPKHKDCKEIELKPKHKYIYPLTKKTREKYSKISKKYP